MRKTTATVAAATLATCQAFSFSPAVASNFGETFAEPEARVSLNWTVPIGHVTKQELAEGDNGLSLRLDLGAQMNVSGEREFVGSPVLDLRLNQLGYASVDALGQAAWSSDPEIMKQIQDANTALGYDQQQQQFFYLGLAAVVIGGIVICVAADCFDDDDGKSKESESEDDDEYEYEMDYSEPVAFRGFY